MQSSFNSCFLRPKPVSNPRMRLVCFPYAGGAASVFHQWPQGLPNDVELIAVQYPGRATRMRETPIPQLSLLLDDIEAALPPMFDCPIAFFGHSMGATVAYELTQRLQAANRPLPKHLFVSGRIAPQLPPAKAPIHHLPQSEFLAALAKLDGTPAEVLEHQELMDILLPIIRADFTSLETWTYQESAPLSIPVSAFGGLNDEWVPLEGLDAWSVCTTGKFKRHVFPGGHFFLHRQQAAMLSIIVRALNGE